VVARRRAAGQAGDQLSVVVIQPGDVGLAAHVEPGVEARRRAIVGVNGADAGHLAIEGDGGHGAWVNAAVAQAAADRLGRGVVEVVGVLLHDAGARVEQRHVGRGLSHERAVRPVEGGFRAACA
jgi:hypothetical protein